MTPTPPAALTDQAARLTRRWDRAITLLAATHPQVAADCLQTLERLIHNVEQMVQEAGAEQPAHHPRPRQEVVQQPMHHTGQPSVDGD